MGDRDYKWIIDLLKDAQAQQALTDLGRNLLTKLEELWPVVEGRGGDLTSVGERQHRGIAHRMYAHYPEVFRKGKKVFARSTMSLRCAMSMVAFCDELKGLFKAVPMAGNIQFVFYKNKKNDILVKVLHNEKEAHLALHTDVFPYYHWKDLRNYLQSLL